MHGKSPAHVDSAKDISTYGSIKASLSALLFSILSTVLNK